MANVIINTNTDIAIGVYDFPDRKKPCLCIRKKGEITIYGTFKNYFTAEAFMKEVAEFFGVTQEIATDTNVGHKQQCTDCKHFVGCECFSGKSCDLFES